MSESAAVMVPRQSANLPSQAVTPMQMLSMAVERGADMAMLEKLMSLQERWEANEARKAYVSAINAFKANPPSLEKNKHVKFGTTEYDHATLDQVCDVIGKALSQHGLSHRWEVEQGEHERITVACVLTHERGHSERVSMSATPDKSGSKNNIQAIGSAATYLQRYTLLAATGLAAKEQDDDGKGSGAITSEQKDEIVSMLRETGADVKKFLDYIGAATVDEIPASKFQNAKAALEKKRVKSHA